MRWQLLLAFATITMIATLGAAALLVIDARNRTLAETTAALDIAEEFVRAASANVATIDDAQRILEQVAVQFSEGRHVKVVGFRKGVDGVMLESEFAGEAPTAQSQPASEFLLHLFGLRSEIRTVSIRVGSAEVAVVRLTGQPSDEFNEAWAGLQTIGLIWIGTNAVIFAILYFVLGHVLQPLSSVAHGMEQLEREKSGVRVPEPKAIELRRVVGSFNHLAVNLEYARRENHRLFRQIMEVQEKERRRIAGELHDEIGPCLFGIMSCVSSIEKLTSGLPSGQREKAEARIAELGAICDRLKQSNRSILNRLYPIAAGHITISQLLEKLLREYQLRHAGINFVHRIDAPEKSYGEERDLLLYRAVQEGVTNAMRHGRPKSITVSLRHKNPNDTATPILLTIDDDGRGLPSSFELGFGLLTMKMRLQACGGSFSIERRDPKGARIRLLVPTVSGTDCAISGEANELIHDNGVFQ